MAMIPEGKTIDDIKAREAIIRDFYREWKKNQKPFERILIMEHELVGIGTVKMTVGVRRSTHEKVQYCITAIDSKE